MKITLHGFLISLLEILIGLGVAGDDNKVQGQRRDWSHQTRGSLSESGHRRGQEPGDPLATPL